MNESIKNLPENMPLTTIVRHSIKAGAEKDFENWVNAIGQKVSTFKGFKGRYVVPPKTEVATNEYIVAFQFENLSDLMTWMYSDERKSALKKLKLFSEKEMQLEHHEGIDYWFTTSGLEAKRPPKWKMAVLTWVAVFPMVLLLLDIYGRLFPSTSLTIKVFFVSITLVGLLTWLLMPYLTKLFKKWLF